MLLTFLLCTYLRDWFLSLAWLGWVSTLSYSCGNTAHYRSLRFSDWKRKTSIIARIKINLALVKTTELRETQLGNSISKTSFLVCLTANLRMLFFSRTKSKMSLWLPSQLRSKSSILNSKKRNFNFKTSTFLSLQTTSLWTLLCFRSEGGSSTEAQVDEWSRLIISPSNY